MNDEYKDLEQELKSMKPRALSDGLKQRIANELERPPVTKTRWQGVRDNWMGYCAIATAAALLLLVVAQRMIIVNQSGDAGAPAIAATDDNDGAAAKVASDEVIVGTMLVGQSYEGPVYVQDGRSVRAVRRKLVDHVTWDDKAAGTNCSMTRPREIVVVLPVEVY